MNAILTIDAIEAWQPDLNCMRVGDQHIVLAVRCFASGGLSNRAIAQRVRRFFGIETDPPERYDGPLLSHDMVRSLVHRHVRSCRGSYTWRVKSRLFPATRRRSPQWCAAQCGGWADESGGGERG
jgi:hypothetical protein